MQKRAIKYIFFTLPIIILAFFSLPHICSAEVNLSNDDVISILGSCQQQPITQALVDELASDNPQPEKQVALIMARGAIRAREIRFALNDIPKSDLIAIIELTAKIVRLSQGDISDIITEIERQTVSGAKKATEDWLNQKEVKVAVGSLDGFNFYSYKNNQQKGVFGYNIVYKPQGDEMAVEIYSPDELEPPPSSSALVSVGSYWDIEKWNKDKIPPFIVRMNGSAIKYTGGGFVWDNATTDVIFNEPVPRIEIAKKTFWEKLKDLVKSLNPLNNSASVSNALISEKTFKQINNDVVKLEESVEEKEPVKIENTIDFNQIAKQIEEISEKIDILTAEIGELTQKEVKIIAEEKTEEKEEVSNTSGGSVAVIIGYPKLLITEAQISGNDDKDEFVELYNPNNTDIDLTDWYLQRKTKISSDFTSYASKTLLSGRIIKAKEYFLISREDSVFASFSDVITSYPLTDDNTVVLKNPNGEIVDKLGYGEAIDYETLAAINPSTSESIGRIYNNEYIDTDNNSLDFEIGEPTPKALNIKKHIETVNCSVLINEIQTAENEFVELYNPGDNSLDLSSCYFSYYSPDRDWNAPYRNKQFPLNSIIPSKGYFLIGFKGYPTISGNPDSDWQIYESEQLNNSSGAVAIFSGNPETGDILKIKADVVGWGSAKVKEGEAIGIINKDKSANRKQDTDMNKDDFEESDPNPINSKGRGIIERKPIEWGEIPPPNMQEAEVKLEEVIDNNKIIEEPKEIIENQEEVVPEQDLAVETVEPVEEIKPEEAVIEYTEPAIENQATTEVVEVQTTE